ncbi:MAG: hypothetical protein B0D92_07170 [Spirochaeta sp. LUC14_002_19_P3]|nr:MAG: hypothetical protein B0D92_07170 [Spirochaeta sp. LUC14_002_19_P3]
MNNLANMSIRLGLIGTAAALLLALVNYFTEPVIEELSRERVQSALKLLVGGGTPGAKEADPALDVSSRWPISPGGGWILEITAKGYGGNMTLLAAYHPDGRIMSAKLLDNNETVGFGKKAEAPGYMDIFVDKGADIPQSKDDLGGDADTVSGATITFNGISKALRLGSNLVKEWEAQ